MKKFFRNLASDERGQSTTEYILMLAVVVMIAMKFKQQFASQLSTVVTKIGGDINTTTSTLENP